MVALLIRRNGVSVIMLLRDLAGDETKQGRIDAHRIRRVRDACEQVQHIAEPLGAGSVRWKVRPSPGARAR